jgi:hypothetical protein
MIETGQQKASLARFLKVDLISPAAEIGDPGKMQAKTVAVIIAAPQPLRSLGKQVLGEIPGVVARAQIRLEHMLMADAFGEARGGRCIRHHVASDGQIGTTLPRNTFGRDTDRADVGTLDLDSEPACSRHLPLGPPKAAGHLVDRHDLLDRRAGIDGL